MSAGGGERGTARAETPMPPVNAWAIEQRGRHHPSTHGPSTTCRVGHQATPRPTPPVDTRAINADSSSATARPNAIAARRARGGGEGPPMPQRRCHLSTRGPSSNAADTTRQGRPRRNTDATCRRVGHRATRPTPPVGAAHAATSMPPVNAWAIEQHGRRHPSGPPTPQRRCHLSTRGPSSKAADTTRRRAEPSTRTPPQRQHDRMQLLRQGGRRARGGGEGPPVPQCG